MSNVSLGPAETMLFSTALISATAQTITPVAAVSGQVIRVYGFVGGGSAATGVTFQDSTAAFTGVISLALGVPLVMPVTGAPYFISAPGASFQIVNTTATLGGILYYTQSKFGG